MAGRIMLAGGEEFRPGCEDVDNALLSSTGTDRPTTLIVPTAAVSGPEKAASDGVTYFSSLGADAARLMVLEAAQANDDELTGQVRGAAVVYFTGGSPDHLLSTLKGSLLLDGLRDALASGAVVGGSSAGAMVMGSMMRRPGSREWVQGLGLVERVAVLPHHERSDPAVVARELAGAVPRDLVVLGIDARTGCFGRPGDWQALGPGKVTVYRDGSWNVFSSGETLPQGF